jgi:hypothetical protein
MPSMKMRVLTRALLHSGSITDTPTRPNRIPGHRQTCPLRQGAHATFVKHQRVCKETPSLQQWCGHPDMQYVVSYPRERLLTRIVCRAAGCGHGDCQPLHETETEIRLSGKGRPSTSSCIRSGSGYQIDGEDWEMRRIRGGREDSSRVSSLLASRWRAHSMSQCQGFPYFMPGRYFKASN